jgi:NADPH:quinone reductase-like Zn-dependent oxidoreductase
MRAVQISRFGGPEVMDADLPDPVPGDGERLVDLSSSGVTFADAHHRLSRD